jgi:hypothetical protein
MYGGNEVCKIWSKLSMQRGGVWYEKRIEHVEGEGWCGAKKMMHRDCDVTMQKDDHETMWECGGVGEQ